MQNVFEKPKRKKKTQQKTNKMNEESENEQRLFPDRVQLARKWKQKEKQSKRNSRGKFHKTSKRQRYKRRDETAIHTREIQHNKKKRKRKVKQKRRKRGRKSTKGFFSPSSFAHFFPFLISVLPSNAPELRTQASYDSRSEKEKK